MRRMINFGPDPNDQGGAGPHNERNDKNERRDPAYSKTRSNNNGKINRPIEQREDRFEREPLEDQREYFHDYDEDDELKRNRLGWRDLLSARAQERVKTIEKVIAGIVTGSRVIKSIKSLSRRQKIAAGAVLLIGAAGATYLATRTKRKRLF